MKEEYKIINGIKVKLPRNSFINILPDNCPSCGELLSLDIDKMTYKRFKVCHKCNIKNETSLIAENKVEEIDLKNKKDNLEYLIKGIKIEIEDAKDKYNDDVNVHDVIDDKGMVEVLYETRNELVNILEEKLKDYKKQLEVLG